jgi:predicted homoserine dehydrogenase-like protein
MEVPLTCTLLAIRRQSNMEPLTQLVSEVFAVAKQDLTPGMNLDGIGGTTFYSLIDRYDIARKERLLPIGLAKNAQLIKAVPRDKPIGLDDVKLYQPSTILELRKLQDDWLDGNINEAQLLRKVDQLTF